MSTLQHCATSESIHNTRSDSMLNSYKNANIKVMQVVSKF